MSKGRQATETILGVEYTLQSVSPRWYFETNDRYGMTGDRKDVAQYMDTMFKNVVISPAEVAQKGMAYFDEQHDIETPEQLIRAIERFLRPGKQQSGGAKAGAPE